ncbi:MAG: cobaltochelatase subunit CobN [Hyphomicrobium sp.]
MHLLVRESRDLSEAAPPEDLGLAPADVVVLSFSDSDLAAVASAWQRFRGHEPNASAVGIVFPNSGCTGHEPDHAPKVPDATQYQAIGSCPGPTLGAANLVRLTHPMSVDLFIEATLPGTKAVLVRLLGGLDYWRYGGEQLSRACRRLGIALAIVPGDGRPDPRLAALSTLSAGDLDAIEALLDAGGVENTRAALAGLLARAEGSAAAWPASVPMPDFGIFGRRGAATASGRSAAIIFYRSHVLAGDTAPIEAMVEALAARGVAATAYYVPSLKAPAAASWLAAELSELAPGVVINATAFSARDGDNVSPLEAPRCPILQVAMVNGPRDAWAASQRGLAPADQAMHVVLPEFDGRLFAGAISFKAVDEKANSTGISVMRHEPCADGIAHVAELAAAWAKLRAKPTNERRLALVLSTYPGRPDQIAHAVGLDALASTQMIVAGLSGAGYALDHPPADARELISRLEPAEAIRWPVDQYLDHFLRLPDAFRESIASAWGAPEDDPSFENGAFNMRAVPCGNLVVALQPERGTLADRKAQYHDPATPPRHGYAAFYLWLRHVFGIDALMHLGAHGTLEWLPGKAVALSPECAPRAVLGPVPLVYPFIVNDPGEAAQAKRRVAAVTLGHKPPPLVETALSAGLMDVERLVDEFSSADGLDPRRRKRLVSEIVNAAARAGIAESCGLTPGQSEADSVTRIDAFLCDVKELSIRDGLHVLDQDEIGALLKALDTRFVEPGPSGAPSRGRADVLPTGRNLYGTDPRGIPTITAWANGRRAATAILGRYLSDHGDWPRAIVMDLWGSATLRTGGEELATALALLGVRPVWDSRSFRVTGVETSPLAELGRPRVDVTLRISGLFRDMFQSQLTLFESAVALVAGLDEDGADNPLVLSRQKGAPLDRIFGPPAGTFGAGVMSRIDGGDWRDRQALGESYLAASSHAHGTGDGKSAPAAFADRVSTADAFVHIQDHREIDVLSGGDFAAHEGGFAAAAAATGNATVALYHGDTGTPDAPRVRTLAEECARVVHGRAASPRWIEGQMRHGFRGAAELASTVDAAFAFAATARTVDDGAFERLYEAYLGDPAVAAFVSRENPAALEAMRRRFEEAVARGLWHPRRNDVQRRAEETSSREAAE